MYCFFGAAGAATFELQIHANMLCFKAGFACSCMPISLQLSAPWAHLVIIILVEHTCMA